VGLAVAGATGGELGVDLIEVVGGVVGTTDTELDRMEAIRPKVPGADEDDAAEEDAGADAIALVVDTLVEEITMVDLTVSDGKAVVVERTDDVAVGAALPQAIAIAASQSWVGTLWTTDPQGSVPIMVPDQPHLDLHSEMQLAVW